MLHYSFLNQMSQDYLSTFGAKEANFLNMRLLRFGVCCLFIVQSGRNIINQVLRFFVLYSEGTVDGDIPLIKLLETYNSKATYNLMLIQFIG